MIVDIHKNSSNHTPPSLIGTEDKGGKIRYPARQLCMIVDLRKVSNHTTPSLVRTKEIEKKKIIMNFARAAVCSLIHRRFRTTQPQVWSEENNTENTCVGLSLSLSLSRLSLSLEFEFDFEFWPQSESESDTLSTSLSEFEPESESNFGAPSSFVCDNAHTRSETRCISVTSHNGD
jgi:hypothetical protein